MDILQLHSKGKTDYLKALKVKLEKMKQKLFNNKEFNTETNIELKELKETYRKEKRNSNKNLY